MNPNKCVFGVPSGQLLGFLVSHRGIEASAKQIRAISEMGPPRSVKDVQKLTGCMAALNHFISRLGEKGLPFFKLIKKTDKFEWTEEPKRSFQEAQGISHILTRSHTSKKIRRHDAVHCGNFYGDQHCDCHRKRRRRTCI